MTSDLIGELFGELAASELPVPARASVVARGRQRRLRARGIAAVSVLAIIAVAGSAVGYVRHAERGAGLGRSPVSHGTSPAGICAAAPGTALQAGLTHARPVSSPSDVTPIALSPDGKTMYVHTSIPGFEGIAAESVATGAVTRIMPLDARYQSPQGGAGPAGELLWTSTNVRAGQQTPVHLWTPSDRSVAYLEPDGQQGGAIGTPVILDRRLAAWEQTDGTRQEIVEADLVTGQVAVVGHGFPGPPVFVGAALVWPAASEAGGAATGLVALGTGVFPARQRVAVPPALAGATRSALLGNSGAGSRATPVGLIASNDGATAFFSPDLTRLYYSPAPSRPARLVLRLAGGATFAADAPAVGSGYLGWTVNGGASYLASTATLAAARITNLGLVMALGPDVIVGYPPATKTAHRNEFHLFTGSAVSALTCAGKAHPGGH